MARATGLEPAASGVTGRRSNQLSYARMDQTGIYQTGIYQTGIYQTGIRVALQAIRAAGRAIRPLRVREPHGGVKHASPPEARHR
jgi:hypothetical protein